MKFITPQFTILDQAPGMEGMLKQIEIAGRTCYKSHDKITEGSAEKFVERMKSLGHSSVLEHGAVYLCINVDDPCRVGINEHQRQQEEFIDLIVRYSRNKYSFVKVNQYHNGAFISTNYRVIIENEWEDDLKYQCEPTEFHEKRVTVRFNTDIGISREFNRHRVNSPSEESTRYCNYSKGKFDGEISVVPPVAVRGEALDEFKSAWSKTTLTDNELFSELLTDAARLINEGEGKDGKEFFSAVDTWLFANLAVQWSYMRLTKIFGWSAQDARSVLPLDTATELVHTAFVSDWENFFKLRCDEHAHPMARELAIPLREEFVKRGLIKE